MDIEVKVNEDEIADRVVQVVAARIVDRTDLYEIAHAAVVAKVQEMAEDKIVSAIDEAFEKPFTPTSRYGESKGDPMTIREMIDDKISTWLKESVDYQGRTADSYNNRGKSLRVHYLIRKHIEDAMKLDLEKLVKEQVETFPKDIGKIVTEAVQQGLKSGVQRMK